MAIETRWWLIRHAPVLNPERLVYGNSDMPADFSHARTRSALEGLAQSLPVDAIWVTSQLSRAIDTARQIQNKMGQNQNLEVVPELAEQDFGDWEKRRWQDLPNGETTRFWTDFSRQQPPNGESFSDVVKRVSTVVSELNTLYAGRDIITVIHGGSVRAVLAHALCLPFEAALSFHIDNLALTSLEYIGEVENPGWRITGVNVCL